MQNRMIYFGLNPLQIRFVHLECNMRILDHRGYFNRQQVDKPIGLYFNIKGHTVLDMIPMIIEEVRPKNDPNLRLIRESWWITQYQSVEFGANTQS